MARTTKPITSMTVQFGGPPILCDQGLADDRDWFGRHHGRNHRIRPPIGGERNSLPPGPPSARRLSLSDNSSPANMSKCSAGSHAR